MKLRIRNAAAFAAIVIVIGGACGDLQAAGLQAELRSSSALIPAGTADAVAPTAPAGAVVSGTQAWTCDAAQGFRPIVPIDATTDPVFAVGSTIGFNLPISPTTTPATCGQMALAGDGTVYITQAVVDTTATPSVSRGVLRTKIDPATGAIVGPAAYIATTAGLDGNQPTAVALGPDGNLYVGFLKSGDIKKIINPGAGTTQIVQKIGNTPSGHPARALTFAGNDLYIASIDALSVIKNSASCTGGCNATAIPDGFSGAVHTGLTSDAAGAVYFAVAGGFPNGSQVWRYVPTTQLFTFVSIGGADRTGGNASSFSFVPAKTNMLVSDASGNLWIGDDPSNATAKGAGRLWTISATALATLPSGNSTGGTNLQTMFNALKGPWFLGFTTQGFTVTFFSDGTFSATIQPNAGASTTDSGTWTLTPPASVFPVGNPQGRLTFTDTQGIVLFSADFLMLNVDMLQAQQPWVSGLGTPISGTLIKQTP